MLDFEGQVANLRLGALSIVSHPRDELSRLAPVTSLNSPDAKYPYRQVFIKSSIAPSQTRVGVDTGS
jgi:hypothetical protein